MGLRQSGPVKGISAADLLLPAAIIAVSSIIAAVGSPARALLKYDRLAIADGEWWRLVSGHFAHLGASHFALNIAGLCLIWLLLGNRISARAWILSLCVIIAGIDLGFWMLNPNLLWYVGLSGVLHGLLVTGALAGIPSSATESAVVLGLVFAKIIYEQIAGPMPGSESASGGPVVVDAHLYGAIAGLLIGIPFWRRVARVGSI